MLSHALRLVWNRRRATVLVVVEIAVAFVVGFVLIALAADLWTNYRRPLGFEFEDAWTVAVNDTRVGGFGFFSPQAEDVSATVDDVVLALRDLPRAATVEPLMLPPFSQLRWQTDFGADADNTVLTRINRATAAGLQSIGVDLVSGRWFGPEDDGQQYRPALVNRTFVERTFGPNVSPIGRQINFPDPNFPVSQLPESQAREMRREVRVVGVIDDFRQGGEFTETIPYAIQRYEHDDARGGSFYLLLKVAPGTPAGFEEDVISTVESVAPGWTASVMPWEQQRATIRARALLPIKIASTIGVFFLGLVVMGLVGVLWQDVVRRTQEIGLRRALGADAGSVRRQIHLETLVVTAFGILIGAAIAVQIPLLELIETIDWAAAAPAFALAAVLVVVLVTVGSLYPAWLASRREPADALRYE